jgi:hypothetical protein
MWKSIGYLQRIVLAQPRLALKLMFREFLRRFYSNELSYGYKYNLTLANRILDPEIPVTIRELSDRDVPLLLNLRQKELALDEFRHLVVRLLFIEAGVPTCFVGVTREDYPCCMCWLIRMDDKEEFHACFDKDFRTLLPRDVLFENVFTSRAFRGKHLRKYLTQRLFEKARRAGAQRAVAFIKEDNAQSLMGATGIGWRPFLLKKTRWRLFRRFVNYESILTNSEFLPFDRPETTSAVSLH